MLTSVMTRTGAGLLGVLAVVALSATSLIFSAQARAEPNGGRAFDPPRLSFVGSVGSVRPGMTRDAVEYLYGDTNQGKLQIIDHYFPTGTKYAGIPLFVVTYRLH